MTTPPPHSSPVAVTAKLSAARVAAYLRRHPRFFDQHPELLTQLAIPHEAGVPSLIERQVQHLRKRHDELTEQLSELMQAARDNAALMIKLHQLHLTLMDCVDTAALGQVLQTGLQSEFGADHVALWCFEPHVPQPWQYIGRDVLANNLPGLTESPRALAGKWRRQELRTLFGEAGLGVSSAALIPLHAHEHCWGLIAIGSHQASHFRSSMDTLFITQLGDVVAHLWRRLDAR